MNLEQKHKALLGGMTEREAPEAEVRNVRLCFELLSLAAAIDRDCATRLGGHGITEGRFVLLFLLRQAADGLSPFELAEKAGVTRATITGLLDGLQKSALVTRHHDGDDRRMVTVRLTPQGRQLAERLFEDHASWIASLLAGFSPEEKAVLSNLLAKLWRNTDAGSDAANSNPIPAERQRIRIPYIREDI